MGNYAHNKLDLSTLDKQNPTDKEIRDLLKSLSILPLLSGKALFAASTASLTSFFPPKGTVAITRALLDYSLQTLEDHCQSIHHCNTLSIFPLRFILFYFLILSL